MSCEIKLPCGRTTLVDPDIWEACRHLSWYADWHGSQWRVVHAKRVSGRCKKVLLSHLVFGPPRKGRVVDHKNGNPFDNRVENLREATFSQNCMNRRPWRSKVHKGVGAVGNKWRSRIRVGGQLIHLGLFATAIEAARAYNKAAKQAFGEFARLNPV